MALVTPSKHTHNLFTLLITSTGQGLSSGLLFAWGEGIVLLSN